MASGQDHVGVTSSRVSRQDVEKGWTGLDNLHTSCGSCGSTVRHHHGTSTPRYVTAVSSPPSPHELTSPDDQLTTIIPHVQQRPIQCSSNLLSLQRSNAAATCCRYSVVEASTSLIRTLQLCRRPALLTDD